MSQPTKSRIEEQLAQYRERKRKEEYNSAKRRRIWETISWIMSFGSSGSSSSTDDPKGVSGIGDCQPESRDGEKEVNTHILRERELRRRTVFSKDSSSGTSTDHSDPQGLSERSFIDTYTTLDWIALGLKCVMWFLLWKVFILLEFGAVYFIFSAFVFIWYNMRSGPKKRGEISAYSVFNPNCEVIDGTFTAEQFERELLHKM